MKFSNISQQTQFWKNQGYFQILKTKHTKLAAKIQKYERTFLSRYQYNMTQEDVDKIESLKLDFDHILTQILHDLNFIKLNNISASIQKLFETLNTIIKQLLSYNRNLTHILSDHKSREDMQNLNKLRCQMCDKRLEEVKLKGLLKIMTNATHQVRNSIVKPTQKINQFQQQTKRLDLDNFYGADRQILMRKINQLLNQKSISLNRKAADTQPTLRSVLNEYFDKGSAQNYYTDMSQLIANYQQKIDLADTLTTTIKNQLLRNADLPLRNFVEKLSEYRARCMLKEQKNSLVDADSQTPQIKSIEAIKNLEIKIKALNNEINGRKQRTQEVQKQLMNQLMQLTHTQRRVMDLTKKLEYLQISNKNLTNTSQQQQFFITKLKQEKALEIDILKKNNYENQIYWKKQITKLQQEIDEVKEKLKREQDKHIKINDSVGVQTLFLKKNVYTQIEKDTKDFTFSAKSGKSIGAKISTGEIQEQENENKKSADLIKLDNSKEQNKQNNILKSNIKVRTLKSNQKKGEISKEKHDNLFEKHNFKNIRSSQIIKSDKKFYDKVFNSTKSLVRNGSKQKNKRYTLQSDQQSSQSHYNQIEQVQQISDTQRKQIDSDKYMEKMKTQYEQEKNVIKQFGKSIKKLNNFTSGIKQKKKAQKLKKMTARYSDMVAEKLFSSINNNFGQDQPIKEKAERLAAVIEQSYDILQKIGIISVLEKLQTKNKQSKKGLSLQNYIKKTKAKQNKKSSKQTRFDINNDNFDLVITTKDFQIYGGYQSALKFQSGKGVWANQMTISQNQLNQINLIIKFIQDIKDRKKQNQLINFLCYPVQSIIYETSKENINTDLVKTAINNLIKFHSYCKPRCMHLKIFFNKLGLQI